MQGDDSDFEVWSLQGFVGDWTGIRLRFVQRIWLAL